MLRSPPGPKPSLEQGPSGTKAAKKPESEPMDESEITVESEKPTLEQPMDELMDDESEAEWEKPFGKPESGLPVNDESGLLDWGKMDSDKPASQDAAAKAKPTCLQDAAGPRVHKKRAEMTPEERLADNQRRKDYRSRQIAEKKKAGTYTARSKLPNVFRRVPEYNVP